MSAPRRPRVVVTGASSGLGEAMARRWATRGHTLGLAARRTDRLDALLAELPGDGHVSAALDVSDPDAVARVVPELVDRLGGLDRFVVNAGIGKGVAVGTGGGRPNRETLLTNAVGAFDQAEAAMAVFRAQGHGHLVLIASVAGVRGLPGTSAAYSASKAALISLGQSLRAEHAGSRIRVTTVLPGFIATEINERPGSRPFTAPLDRGADALVAAIDREPATTYVPTWPWAVVGRLLPRLPDRVVGKAG